MALNPADFSSEGEESSFEEEDFEEEEVLSEEGEEEEGDGTYFYSEDDDDWEGQLLRRAAKAGRGRGEAPDEAPAPCVGAHRCVYCCIPAAVACPKCEDEFYCGKSHMKKHRKDHKAVCVRKAGAEGPVPQPAAAAVADAEDACPEAPLQDSPLLRLPEEVLLQICHSLRASDLVRLGWVCGRLRALCRGRAAWSRARFPGDDFSSFSSFMEEQRAKKEGRPPQPRLNKYGVLRVAPALHTLIVDGWPPVNLLRYTNHVQVFEFEWEEDELVEDEDKNRLYYTLRHYADHLQEVRLDCLHEMKILRLIDGMKNIKRLKLASQVVKVYPGCEETITSLELGAGTSNEVAADILRANRHSLTSFTVSSDDENRWASDGYRSPVCLALQECVGLETASIPTWGRIAIVDSFPQLRSLSIQEFGNPPEHAAMKRFFETSPVARALRILSLELDYHAHRGLIQVVASGCASLRQLSLLFRSSGRMDFVDVHVDVPRDLHVILGRLGDLEKLTLYMARMHCSFFNGLAAGALPNLTVLKLTSCGVTSKGRAALAAMQAQRKNLTVKVGRRLARANVEPHDGWDWLSARCTKAMCRAESDCDEDDTVSEVDDSDESDCDEDDTVSEVDDSDGSGGSSFDCPPQ